MGPSRVSRTGLRGGFQKRNKGPHIYIANLRWMVKAMEEEGEEEEEEEEGEGDRVCGRMGGRNQ